MNEEPRARRSHQFRIRARTELLSFRESLQFCARHAFWTVGRCASWALLRRTMQAASLITLAAACLLTDAASSLQLSRAGRALQEGFLTVESSGLHVRFAEALERARASFSEADATFSEAEIAVETPDAAHSTLSTETSPAAARAGVAAALIPSALRSLSDGISTIKRVRRDVALSSTSKLPAEIKAQVLWDLDRMSADAEKLHAASLAPLVRRALHKALSLRFGVLLTPAFWTSPIKRSMLDVRNDDA